MTETAVVKWTRRAGIAGLWLGVAGPLAALIAASLYGAGTLPLSLSFRALMIGFVASAVGVILLAGGIFAALKAGHRGRMVANGLVIVVAGGFVLNMFGQISAGRAVPAIHDVTTDLTNPPVFETLTPNNPNGADWATKHQKAYGDLVGLSTDLDVAAATTRAADVADRLGWSIAVVDPQQGRVEATETSFFFRFKDDVVVRVTAAEGGQGSLVDVRSVSRVGMSDIGVNAKRIRKFLAAFADF